MAIQNDNWVSFNLNELVSIRASFLQEELSEDTIDDIASYLRKGLTWDTMYGMIDQAILEFFENHEHPEIWDPHYGEIQPEPGREDELNKLEKAAKQREKARKEFEMVDLVSPAWTIQVPRRITNVK